MRTYTHGIIGYLLYVRSSRQQKLLAIIGAMIPDTFLVIGFIFDYLGNSAIVESMHHFFHRSFLHILTEAMHSFVFIIPLLILAFLFHKKTIPFFVGMVSHAILDLLTHQRWVYNHFYPLPLEPLTAIFSYTSIWFTLVEHIFVLIFIFWIVSKKFSKR